MGNYTAPNISRGGKTLAYNDQAVIHPGGQAVPTKLQRFATGSIPVAIPRQPVTVTPSSTDQLTIPQLKRGR